TQNQPSESAHYIEDLPRYISLPLPTSSISIPIDYCKYPSLHPPRAKNAKEFAHVKKKQYFCGKFDSYGQ
ncbi:MAG: hypothetical protein IKD12_05915, partial [Paludibacteraceae bacterium]|nr:hypothetical protein [Paludibacteraceae bacterium]